MFKRNMLIIGSYFILSGLSVNPAEAGFTDFLKNIQKALQGDQALTREDIIHGLKEALEIGAANAVKEVSVVNGYYSNPKIKIPLPENIQNAKKWLTRAGLGSQVRSFELSMNRAAERAAPRAICHKQ